MPINEKVTTTKKIALIVFIFLLCATYVDCTQGSPSTTPASQAGFEFAACGLNLAGGQTNGLVPIQIHVDPQDTIVVAISTLQPHTTNAHCSGNCSGVLDFQITDTFGNSFSQQIDAWVTGGAILGDQDTLIWSNQAGTAMGSGVDTITVSSIGSGPIDCSTAGGCYNTGNPMSPNGSGHYVACVGTYSGISSIVSSASFALPQTPCNAGLCGPLVSPTGAISLPDPSDTAVVVYGSDNSPSYAPGGNLNTTWVSGSSCNANESCSNTYQQSTYNNCAVDMSGVAANTTEILMASGTGSNTNGDSPANLCWVDLTSQSSGATSSSIDWYVQDNSDVSFLILH
jgi:hypothetical protein